MPVYALDQFVPQIHETAWLAPSAVIIGQTSLASQVNVWFGATIRADNTTITIGARSNVQENAVLHVDPGFPLTIGEDVTIGHQAMLHGCTIGNGSLIGIQAIVLNGAVIGKSCLIGAGALVTEGQQIPDGSLVIGAPAKVARALTPEQIAGLNRSAASYVARAEKFRAQLKEITGQSGGQ